MKHDFNYVHRSKYYHLIALHFNFPMIEHLLRRLVAGMDEKKSAEKEADIAQQVMGLTIDI